MEPTFSKINMATRQSLGSIWPSASRHEYASGIISSINVVSVVHQPYRLDLQPDSIAPHGPIGINHGQQQARTGDAERN